MEGPKNDDQHPLSAMKAEEFLDILLSTREGRHWLAEMLEKDQSLFKLTDAEEAAFGRRWNDGFVKQVISGEFELHAPLTDAEKDELHATSDQRRKWLLELRRRRNADDPDRGRCR
jgi:hypothetical protein